MGTLHKERRSVVQHDRDHRGSFTQVRAAARRKTLLLLWLIDGRTVVGTQRSSSAGLLRGEGGYVRMSVQGSESFLRSPWPSFYRSRGHHKGKSVIVY